ncbi:hypothetical protein HDU91_002502, partial [Kappamyces sp. JEL0680]
AFAFSFDLPEESPSSYSFTTLSKLCYSITGSVQFKYGNHADTVFKTVDVRVVERWDPVKEKSLSESITAFNHRKVFMGGDGKVLLAVTLKNPFCTAGSNFGIDFRVRNESKKRVQGLKVSFLKRLIMVCATDSGEQEDGMDLKTVNEMSSTFLFKDKGFDPMEDRSGSVFVTVPPDAQTIRNTHLAEIMWFCIVSLQMPGMLRLDVALTV